MKIALVARHAEPQVRMFDPYTAELADHVFGLGRALAAQGHHVVIQARKDAPGLPGRQAIAPRLSVEYLAAGPAARVPADELPRYASDLAGALAASWRRHRPDVVHAHHWTSALAALAAARDTQVPVITTFGSFGSAERRHGIVSECPAVRQRLEPAIARGSASVLATTGEEVAELSRLGVRSAKVACVPTGVDVKAFKPAGYSVRRGKQPRLIALGSLAGCRRLDVVLRCLAELPGTELVIAGGPAASELECDHGYRILAKLAAHLGVTDRVRFTGHVSEDKLPALLRSADLLVSAACYEPQGSAAIRAMACGIPVVATSVGGYEDAVIDGTCGVLIPPERPALLAGQLRDLLATPMRLAAFGIAAADRARSRYPWARVAEETAVWYERTTGRVPHLAGACAIPSGAGAARSSQRRPGPAAPDLSLLSRSRRTLVPVGEHAA